MLTVHDHHLKQLLHGVDTATLVHITHMCNLPRVPGLSNEQLIDRLLSKVPPHELYNHLIAARFGLLSLDDLLTRLLDGIPYEEVPINRPRMDRINPHNVTVINQRPGDWVFTMRGHDVRLNLAHQLLSCDCRHFQFASRYGAICKHIATGFQVIPPTYARPALIDLLVQRELNPQRTTWALSAL